MYVFTWIGLHVSLCTLFFTRILCQNPRVSCLPWDSWDIQLGCLMTVAGINRALFASCTRKWKEVVSLEPSLTAAITDPLFIARCTSFQRCLHSRERDTQASPHLCPGTCLNGRSRGPGLLAEPVWFCWKSYSHHFFLNRLPLYTIFVYSWVIRQSSAW